jgi:RNA polymerase sigma-70 factor (ECF subfamily)
MNEDLVLNNETEKGAADSEAPAMELDDDSRLIQLFRDGDRVAFDRLVLKYQRQIIAFCVRQLGNYSDGEEAAQETFFKVYRNISQFRGDCCFSTWIYTIAVNTCRNMGQSWWKKLWKGALKIDKPVSVEDGDEEIRDLRDTRNLPSKDLDRKCQAEEIKEALSKLPAIHKELIILRDFQELHYEEIEKITGLSSGTIKSRLARARAALQNELKGLKL